MPLFGTLTTMPLPDLLQWIASARKTGTLHVERNRVSKWLLFEGGELIGCSSDDPPQRLGHFLLSRGRITEDQLRIALVAQEATGHILGRVLVDMGVLSGEMLTAHLEAKAEETVFSLFDWTDAVFRFHETLTTDAPTVPVRLGIEDVLLRGMQRLDETCRIREVIHGPGIVLRRTASEPGAEVLGSTSARQLYDAIDGSRTVAEILLHVHGSEYLVTKFLYELVRNGFAEVAAVRELPEGAPASALAPLPGPGEPSASRDGADAARASALAVGTAVLDAPAPTSTSAGAEPDLLGLPDVLFESGDVEPIEHSPAHLMERDLTAARAHMSAGDCDLALEILDRLYRRFPDDEALRRLTAEAEAAFRDKAYRHYLPAKKVPVVAVPTEQIEAQDLSPTEYFLLSRIDGRWDVRSIIQISPLREIDVLLSLKRMRERGIIDLRDPTEGRNG